MNVITEQEKRQWLDVGKRDGGAEAEKRRRPPGAPRLPVEAYFRQLDQLAQLFPPPLRRPPVGTQWKL